MYENFVNQRYVLLYIININKLKFYEKTLIKINEWMPTVE